MSVKQILVVRKDLNMRKGKIAVQCCHASMKVFLDMGRINTTTSYVKSKLIDTSELIVCPVSNEMKEWIEGLFTKICVSVNSEEELLEVYNKARGTGIPCALITDSGLTEFNGVPTKTCCAIGPDDSEKIDKITGGLKLL